MRTTSALAIGTLLAVAISEARADPVQLRELPHHITEATTTIDATPSEVYELITSYASWPSFLSDVTYVRVERGGRHDARVRFKSRTLENRAFTIEFDNIPDAKIAFRGIKGPPGGRAWGTMLLQPIDGGKRTFVRAHLFMDVVGLPGWFMRESAVRPMRRAKLRVDLADGAAYFERLERVGKR